MPCCNFQFCFIKLRFDLILYSSNPRPILLEPRIPSSSNFHHNRGRSLTDSSTIKISLNIALACPSSNIPLFLSNPEDQDTFIDNNEQEKDDSEATSTKKEMDLKSSEVIVQTQRDLELSLKRRKINRIYHKI